jgi:hypothetical protein
MRITAWIAGFLGLCALPAPARGQVDVSCPTTLRPRFDSYQPVAFQGKAFETYWQNTAGGPMGGPSYAWFSATPNPDPISTDGRARWRRARILVHCFATLLWGGNRTYHYHPIAYNGTLESTSTACSDPDDPPEWGGGEYVTTDPVTGPVPEDGTEPLTRLRREPAHEGAPPDTYMMDCGSSGGGGSGAGSMSCRWEYMIIEISYDGGKTWHVWWEGWGQTCEQNEA